MGLFDKMFKGKSQPLIKPEIAAKSKPNEGTPGNAGAVDTPDFQGDYAQAVFLNAYSKASPIKKQNEYQSYLLYECGIVNASAFHRVMIHDGYLEEATLLDRIQALKVSDIKALLVELNLPTTGKKEVLVQRAVDAADSNIVLKFSPDTTYAISEKGRAFLAENDAYVKIHQHRNWGVTWQEYDARKKPGFSFNDIVWGILNERAIHSPHFGRNEYLSMAQLLIEEGKRPNAIEMLLQVFYLDVSGTEGIEFLKLYSQGIWDKKQAKDCFGASVMLAPWVYNTIAEYGDVYTDDMVHRIYDWKLPVQICPESLFLQIVHSLMDDSFNHESCEDTLKKCFDKYVDGIR